ncbi:MAG TPA: hypothetical protein VMJ10_13935 [Kofleriaceae bacterium]|nr:hypothetical protein [Kofleriaceae bacterium]
MEEQPPPEQPPQQPPQQPPPPELPMAVIVPQTAAPAETWTRSFFLVSLRRAYRLDIKVDEVLPQERSHLARQASHIRNPEHQAFLAWRRSVLLLVAVMFVPLTVFRFFEIWDGPDVPHLGRAFLMLPAIAEGLFAIVAFDQLRHWAQWKRQRRALFIAWALYFVAPFIVYGYPFRNAYGESYWAAQTALNEISGGALHIARHDYQTLVGLAFGMQALLVLGPKVISLMPGLIRASIVTKLQFPGTAAPGWLMLLAAPIYALFAYIIFMLPYQVTGSWQFLVGNLGIVVAQIFIGVSGRRLTVPLTNDESYHRVHKTYLAYIGILLVSLVFVVYGLHEFIKDLHMGTVRVVTALLSLVANVLLDTLIGTDAIVAAMAYFRRRSAPDPAHAKLMAEAEARLDVFTA